MGEGDGSIVKKLLVRMPKQLQGRRRGGKRLTRSEYACHKLYVRVCVCVPFASMDDGASAAFARMFAIPLVGRYSRVPGEQLSFNLCPRAACGRVTVTVS